MSNYFKTTNFKHSSSLYFLSFAFCLWKIPQTFFLLNQARHQSLFSHLCFYNPTRKGFVTYKIHLSLFSFTLNNKTFDIVHFFHLKTNKFHKIPKLSWKHINRLFEETKKKNIIFRIINLPHLIPHAVTVRSTVCPSVPLTLRCISHFYKHNSFNLSLSYRWSFFSRSFIHFHLLAVRFVTKL